MLTRNDAIKIAREHARESTEDQPYLIGVDDEDWMPHEWVIAAILFAANGHP